jgi:glutamate/tyrosine decarboxylase-like PLP-dependent enzyme
MLPPTTIYSLASSNIAHILNQNVIAQEVSPAFTQMENVVVSYLSDLI